MLRLLLALPLLAASPRAAVEKDRADTRKWLKSEPTSYLAAVQRVSFGNKASLSVGSAPGNDLVVEGLSPRHLSVTVEGDTFLVSALDSGASFSVGKGSEPKRSAKTGPAKLGLGPRFALRLSHQGYPALILFDAKSPRFAEYKGIPYFPIDLAYRVKARLIPDPKAEKVAIASSASADRTAERVGWFEFELGGKALRLAAHRLIEPGSPPDALNVFFRDATTGKESYKVGRYVEPERQADGAYILDFNMAYSPACAYSKFYNCPIPPRENQLPVAIRAGEKDPPYH